MLYTCGDVALWLLCELSIDRFLVIMWPTRRNRSIKSVIVILLSLIFVSGLKNSPYLKVNTLVSRAQNGTEATNATQWNCVKDFSSGFNAYFLNNIRQYLILLTSSVIPVVIIGSTNIYLFICIKKQSRRVAALVSGNASALSHQSKLFLKVTWTISIAYVFFLTPFFTINTLSLIYAHSNPCFSSQYRLLQLFFLIILQLNFCSKLFLYVLVSSVARNELKRLFSVFTSCLQ